MNPFQRPEPAHHARAAPPRRRGPRPATIAVFVVLVTMLALSGIDRIRLQADLATLLPRGTPVADAYRTFFEQFDGLEQVFVVVEAARTKTPAAQDATEPADLARVAAMLETELALDGTLTDVRAGPTEADEHFVLHYVVPRAPLLMDDEHIQALASRLSPEAIATRVEQLHASLATPAAAFHRQWAPNDPLGLARDLPALQGVGGLPLDGWTSVFLTPEGDTALVVATPTATEIDPAGGRAVETTIDNACSTVGARTGIAFRCRAVGGPLYAAQDERLLRRDLKRTIIGSSLATTAVLVLAFEGVLLPFAVLVPLLVGLLWGAGVLGWWSPDISAVSIGFGAVLIGLGVDYAIHLATRFRQHYGESGSGREALTAAAIDCGPGLTTSAFTTASGFAVLCLAQLEPLRQVGMLVAVGIIAVLIALATVGGAMLVAVAPRMPRPGAAWRRLGRMVDATVERAVRHPRTIVTVALVLSVAAIGAIGSLRLDADPRALRPADPPAQAVEALLVDRFGVGLDTAHVLVHGTDTSVALNRARAATALLRAQLPAVARVSSPSDYLVTGEAREQKLQTLRALPFDTAADALEQQLRAANLNPRAFAIGIEALRSFARGEDPGPPRPDQWPPWLASSIRPGAERAWASVAVRTPMGSWSGPDDALLDALTRAAPDAAMISADALGQELRTQAASDVRRLAGFAVAVIAMVVLISFRGRPVPSVLAMLPVVLGALWTLGLWAALGRPLDLFSLAVLPILIGIGIDDGLHVMHGARRRDHNDHGSHSGTSSHGDIPSSVRGAGRALLLTTITTAAGFASLLLSDIPGLRNGGALIALGVSACWLATMLVLPAIGTLVARAPTMPETATARAEHSPGGGPWRRWLGAFHVTGIFWFRIHRWGTRALPTWLIGPTVVVFTSFFFVVLRRARAAIASNLVPILGPCGWWQRQVRIFKTFWQFAWCLTERYEQMSTDRRVDVTIDGEDIWNQALDDPKGLVLVTAHIGHWEVGSMLASTRHVHVVREEEVDARAQTFMREMFAEQPGDAGFTMHFVHGDPVLGMKLLTALRRGEIVALQGDRPRTGGRVLASQLFGKPFDVPLGPLALARAANVVLLPAYVFRVGRYQSRVVIRPPIAVSNTGGEPLEAPARQIANEIEWAVRQAPHQWFCFRKLWPNKVEPS